MGRSGSAAQGSLLPKVLRAAAELVTAAFIETSALVPRHALRNCVTLYHGINACGPLPAWIGVSNPALGLMGV